MSKGQKLVIREARESIAYLSSSGLGSLSSKETVQKVRGEWFPLLV